jgi:hypothetical protein
MGALQKQQVKVKAEDSLSQKKKRKISPHSMLINRNIARDRKKT